MTERQSLYHLLQLPDNSFEPEKFQSSILSRSSTEIKLVIEDIIKSFPSDGPIVLERLSYAIPFHEDALEISETLIELLWSIDIPEEYHPQCSAILLNTIDELEEWKVERLCFLMGQKLCIACIGSHIIFTVLGTVLVKLASDNSANNPPIESLCSSTWSQENLLGLLTTLHTFTLPVGWRKKIIVKALTLLDDWSNPVNLSSIVRQIALFSTKNHLPLLLSKLDLIDSCRDVNSQPDFMLTTLPEFVSICKLNDEFTSSLFNAVKASGRCIASKVYLSLLLVVMGNENFRSSAVKLASNAVVNNLIDSVVINESALLRKLCDPPIDVCTCINYLIDGCIANPVNNHHLSIGLIHLAFSLLQLTASTAFRDALSRAGLRPKACSSPFLRPNQLRLDLRSLAQTLLCKLFKYIPSCQVVIMDFVCDHLWSDSSSPYVSSLAILLGDLIALCPLPVAGLIAKLKPVVSTLELVPLELAVQLVHAVLPLLRAGQRLATATDQSSSIDGVRELRSNLLTTLCRAASSSRLGSRRLAVSCFVVLLKHLRVPLSSFRSASQFSSSSSSMSQLAAPSQTQSTQLNPHLLYTQLQSTQKMMMNALDYHPRASSFLDSSLPRHMFASRPKIVIISRSALVVAVADLELIQKYYNDLLEIELAQQAIALPCDATQNEALCTEIVSILHRVMFSAFICPSSQAGGPFIKGADSSIKPDLYLGLCEVVSRNKGICGPVLNLYLRRLTESLMPEFLSQLKAKPPSLIAKQSRIQDQEVVPQAPAFDLSRLVIANPVSSEPMYKEHPDIILWCLQLITTLPQFNPHWARYRSLSRNHSQSDSCRSDSTSASSSSSIGNITLSSSAFSQSANGQPLPTTLFRKAVCLLVAISDSLRLTPLEVYGFSPQIDFTTSPGGKLNRNRASLLLGLYDACLEFNVKDPLDIVKTKARDDCLNIEILFTRRQALQALLTAVKVTVSSTTSGLPSTDLKRCHSGLMMLSLASSCRPTPLRRILHRTLRPSSPDQSTIDSLAQHCLKTITNRLNALFDRHTDSGLPYAYRLTLGDLMLPVLKSVIRLANNHLTSSQPAANKQSTTTLALDLLQTGIRLSLDLLGSDRFHLLCAHLRRVASDPVYRSPIELLNGTDSIVDASSLEDEQLESDEEEDVEEEDQFEDGVLSAQGLSMLVKMVKSWVTTLLTIPPPSTQLNSSSSALLPVKSNQHHQREQKSKQLALLLPLLVRLCRARACMTSGGSSSTLADLDRVLGWLLRLMHNESPSSSLPGQSQLQLINQSVWLAQLIGSLSDLTSAPASSGQQPSVDQLLVNLATNLRCTFSDDKNSSLNASDPESSLTFLKLSRSTGLQLIPLIYSALGQLLSDSEWLLSSITPTLSGRISLNEWSIATSAPKPIKLAESVPQEESLAIRLVFIGQVLTQLLQTSLPAPSSHVDNLLDYATRSFNFATQFVKYFLRLIRSKSGMFPVVFERVVRVFGRDVAPNAYTFISYIQEAQAEKLRANSELKVSKKSGKVINRVNNTECQDQTVSDDDATTAINRNDKLTTQSKKLTSSGNAPQTLVNLMRNVKLTMSRDFRIDRNRIVAQLDHSDSDSDAPPPPPPVISSTAVNYQEETVAVDDDEARDEGNVDSESDDIGVVDPSPVLNDPDPIIITANEHSQVTSQTSSTTSSGQQSQTPAWDRRVKSSRQSVCKRSLPLPNLANATKRRRTFVHPRRV